MSVWARIPWLRALVQPPRLLRGWLPGRLVTWRLGNRGERAAARYLREQGFRILAQGYRTPLGEIDLIAIEGDCVVFVEVKTRRTCDAGDPVEAVDRAKQTQLTRLALAFLKQQGWLERRARFDVIAILWPEDGAEPELRHYRNAFEAVGRGQMYS